MYLQFTLTLNLQTRNSKIVFKIGNSIYFFFVVVVLKEKYSEISPEIEICQVLTKVSH